MTKEPVQPKDKLPGRHCAICGKIGGMGSTTILRLLGYNIPHGQIGYAHPSCFQKERKKQAEGM